jgi:hypothetical protein
VLPPHGLVHGIAPGAGLLAAGVAAEVLGVLDFGKYLRGPVVRMWLLAVPSLARDSVLGHVHRAQVKATTATNTLG